MTIALREFEGRGTERTDNTLLESLWRDVFCLFDEGRFRAYSQTDLTYLHSHCYALEGLIGLGASRDSDGQFALEEGAVFLEKVQAPEGGIQGWHDGRRVFGSLRADATAQAVRIWSVVDKAAFAVPIRRAVRFLGSLQAPEGGLYYEPGSRDINTWATVFAAQASLWIRYGAQPMDLV
jgi:hypothetical protein